MYGHKGSQLSCLEGADVTIPMALLGLCLAGMLDLDLLHFLLLHSGKLVCKFESARTVTRLFNLPCLSQIQHEGFRFGRLSLATLATADKPDYNAMWQDFG